jgi:hypothetical protein
MMKEVASSGWQESMWHPILTLRGSCTANGGWTVGNYDYLFVGDRFKSVGLDV